MPPPPTDPPDPLKMSPAAKAAADARRRAAERRGRVAFWGVVGVVVAVLVYVGVAVLWSLTQPRG